jgi:GH24 family phage-related lysozyme (muramidase)
MELGAEGFKLDEAWEGIARWEPTIRRYIKYRDAARKWTIGRGHLLTPQEIANDVFRTGLTLEGCDALFRSDTVGYVTAANQAVEGVSADQHQFDAIFVLAYNIGTAGMLTSTAIKLFRQGASFDEIRPYWLGWDKRWDEATQTLVRDQGLLNRRISEFELFCSPMTAPAPPPLVAPVEQERMRMIRGSGQTLLASLRILGIEEDSWLLAGIGEGHDTDPPPAT